MATNLSIEPQLIERALEVSGEATKKAAVTRALEEFIARRRQKRLLDLLVDTSVWSLALRRDLRQTSSKWRLFVKR